MLGVTDEQYQVLYTFRLALRRFTRWSDEASAEAGLTSQQHQLLLGVRAHPDTQAPSIGDVAGYLMIRHHSAVELVRRVEAMGMLSRSADEHDHRVVRLELTERGARTLDGLSSAHMAELQRAAATLHVSEEVLQRLSEDFIETVPAEDA